MSENKSKQYLIVPIEFIDFKITSQKPDYIEVAQGVINIIKSKGKILTIDESAPQGRIYCTSCRTFVYR